MNNNKGLTLIELMIGISIILILLAGLAGIFQSSMRTYVFNYDHGSNLQDSREALQLITEEIRSATDISLPVLSTSSTEFNYQILNNDNQIIICRIYRGSDLDQNTIIIQKGNTVTRIANNRLNRLVFTRTGTTGAKNLIQVDLELQNVLNPNSPILGQSIRISTLNNISSP